ELKLIEKGQVRVIAGPTPVSLVTRGLTVDNNALLIGGTTTLRLSVQNNGGSTATDVTVKLKSGLVQLHGVSIAFGTIQPGKTIDRSVDVSLPADTPGDSATIILTFTEGGGHSPPDL